MLLFDCSNHEFMEFEIPRELNKTNSSITTLCFRKGDFSFTRTWQGLVYLAGLVLRWCEWAGWISLPPVVPSDLKLITILSSRCCREFRVIKWRTWFKKKADEMKVCSAWDLLIAPKLCYRPLYYPKAHFFSKTLSIQDRQWIIHC